MPEVDDAFEKTYAAVKYPLCGKIIAREWFGMGYFACEVAAQQLAEADRASGEKCPYCSFDPTASSDYCGRHRPAA